MKLFSRFKNLAAKRKRKIKTVVISVVIVLSGTIIATKCPRVGGLIIKNKDVITDAIMIVSQKDSTITITE